MKLQNVFRRVSQVSRGASDTVDGEDKEKKVKLFLKSPHHRFKCQSIPGGPTVWPASCRSVWWRRQNGAPSSRRLNAGPTPSEGAGDRRYLQTRAQCADDEGPARAPGRGGGGRLDRDLCLRDGRPAQGPAQVLAGLHALVRGLLDVGGGGHQLPGGEEHRLDQELGGEAAPCQPSLPQAHPLHPQPDCRKQPGEFMSRSNRKDGAEFFKGMLARSC